MQDSNPIVRFLARPFVRSLFKLAAYITVGWNVFVTSVILSIFFGAILIGVLFAGGDTSTAPVQDSIGELEYVYGDASSANQLLLIPVKGEIVGESTPEGFGSFSNVASGYEIKQKLYDAAFRPEVRGVLLAIDSPGGTIYGSRAIADGIKFYQEKTKQPVFAHIEGLGASGAYMAALPASQIAADYGTEIGSIGIIMGPFKYYDKPIAEDSGLLEGGVITQNGIENVILSAGKSKDFGNPYRRLTEEEKAKLQQSINIEYDEFVQMVSAARDIPAATIRDSIGALVYDPKTAQSHKLIDFIDSRESTYAKLAQAAKIKDYQVLRENQTLSFFENLLGAVGRAPAKKADAQFDTCGLTQSKLAYYGSMTNLCKEE